MSYLQPNLLQTIASSQTFWQRLCATALKDLITQALCRVAKTLNKVFVRCKDLNQGPVLGHKGSHSALFAAKLASNNGLFSNISPRFMGDSILIPTQEAKAFQWLREAGTLPRTLVQKDCSHRSLPRETTHRPPKIGSDRI